MRILLATITALILGACGGGGTGDDGASDAATTGPGTVTVALTGMVGVQGKILLGTLTATADPNHPVAGLCVPVTSSPFSMAEVMKALKVGVNNPCDLDVTAKVADAGTYQLTLGVYTGGSQTPELCSSIAVAVEGETHVVAPLPAGC